MPLCLALAAAANAFLTSCNLNRSSGTLHVKGRGSGLFEIYKVASERPLQLVSEHVSRFNEDIKLPPGRYLVLADCSSETITILPNVRHELITHQVNFIPAIPPAETDKFSIQCKRAEKTRSRQLFTNRFSLNMIGDRHDILVGMVPLHLEFKPLTDGLDVQSFLLSAIKVDGGVNIAGDLSFFVSPAADLVSVTEKQNFGSWVFLLPGKYEAEVNGTKMSLDLAQGEQRVIQPAYLKVSTSNGINLELSSQIRGTPLFVDVNDGHWFNLNEQYAVLPGKVQLKLSGSTNPKEVLLTEGQAMDLEARSIIVDQGCSPWEWNCLGDLEVRLYEADQTFPFATGVTDVPLLFFETSVLVGVEGSRNIKMKIPNNARNFNLNLGYIEINPQPIHVKGQITDLLRMEAADGHLSGVSLDISLERSTKIPLIAGQYQLVHYVMSTTNDGDRRRNVQRLRIGKGQSISLPIQVYLSEKRMASFRKAQGKNQDHSGSHSQESAQTNSAPARTLGIPTVRPN